MCVVYGYFYCVFDDLYLLVDFGVVCVGVVGYVFVWGKVYFDEL